jgi:hypothetical protein
MQSGIGGSDSPFKLDNQSPSFRSSSLELNKDFTKTSTQSFQDQNTRERVFPNKS